MADVENKKSQKPKSTVLGSTISIFFIGIDEFCEHCIRSMIPLFLRIFFNWYDLTTTVHQIFVALSYLTPIFGALIADLWLGKFKTIVYLSIVYVLGQIVLTISSIHDITDSNQDGIPDNIPIHMALSMIGLSLFTLGTGGIKPCVAAFGGDQFLEHEKKKRSIFFSVFYFSMNAGMLLSIFIRPKLSAHHCGIHTKQLCFPLTFGVPAAVMAVGLVVFIVGSRLCIKVPPQRNILVKVCCCIGFAIKNRFLHRDPVYPRRKHWMDWAEEKHDKLLIAQVKMVLKVLFLFIPLPLFWALIREQSRWIFQAEHMNGDFGLFVIQPGQMQTLGPIMILVLVVIMESIIYPLVAKCNLNFTPLKRMTVGMFLTALAFISAAVVQLQIDRTLTDFPSANNGQAKFINLQNKPMFVGAGEYNFPLAPFEAKGYMNFDKPFHLNLGSGSEYLVNVMKKSRSSIVIFQDEEIVKAVMFSDASAKPWNGENKIRFLNGYGLSLDISGGVQSFGNVSSNDMSHYIYIPQGEAKFLIRDDRGEVCQYNLSLGFSSAYTLIIPSTFTFERCKESIIAEMDISPNSVHIAWQIPQYFLIAAGEVMFSVTGLEFTYTQTPSNMKSMLQAGWLFTYAVAVIFAAIFPDAWRLQVQWAEYILFASLLVVVCIIFAINARFYLRAGVMPPSP
ncbi:solute carrier family 15 member 1-like [Halichoeres trimaculatus]|uniref:solute carrier family 15 member 1-like n=1 Tax=Halichoeres trimaculatus TaxID=147232 RepID=UPI003D9DFDF5